MSARGKFIVLEGLDGAGTTTQSEILASRVRESGSPTFLTGEPTGGRIGKLVRGLVESDPNVSARSLALLFAADREAHLFDPDGGIVALLDSGTWVICDRYLLSTFAYQSAEGVSLDYLIDINSFAPPADMTIFLDVSPETCMERVVARGTTQSRFEVQELLGSVWVAYSRLNSGAHLLGPVEIIDGSGPIEDVASAVHEIVRSLM
jgi:dTMP kinase